MVANWLRRWLGPKTISPFRKAAPSRPPKRRSIYLELLEERIVPVRDWSGTIPNGTVWANTEVHRIIGEVTVPAGATLTIEPGTIVKVNVFNAFGMTVAGTLDAHGTAAQPIVFTSGRDDSAGGDTDNNGVTAGGNGDWNRIEFVAGSSGSVMDHVEVRFGGSHTLGQVFVNGGALTLTNSVLRNSVNAGLRVAAASPTVTGITFQNNNLAAVSMDLASNPAISGVTVVNNGVNGVRLDAGNLVGNGFWDDPEIVYYLSGNVTAPAGQTLTVAAGTIVKVQIFNAIGITVAGTLDARGTAAQPIIFTSLRDDSAGGDTDNNGPTVAANGDWNTIEFAAGSTGCVMDHVEVRFGGSHAPGQVFVNGGALTLTNSVLRNSVNAGLRVAAANPTVTGISFQNNSVAAASMDLASNPAISGVTVVNNGINGLRLDGGNLVGNGFWDDPDIVYYLSGNVTVPAGRTLTVAAGTIVKVQIFNAIGITVAGTLDARGTAAQPIIFTSLRDDSAGGDTDNNGVTVAANGNWDTMQFAAGSTGSVMDHVEVRFGGSHAPGQVFVNGAALTLTNSVLRNSNTAGLRVASASPTVTGITFQNNTAAAASMDLASNPAISGVTVVSNGINGLRLDGGNLVGNGFWNDPDITYHLAGNVTVPAGQTLTVAAGTIIKVNVFNGLGVTVAGTLDARGTTAQPIIFTSGRDDSARGDTDNNGVTVAANGDWNRIEFAAGSTGSVMDHVEVRFGGSHAPGEVFVNGGALTLTNSVLRNSVNAGLRVVAASPTVTGNTFQNNSAAAVSMDLASNPAISGVTVVNNGINGLRLDGGNLVGNGFWDDPDIVYHLSGNVTVPAGQTLTVAVGTIVKSLVFNGIGVTVAGTLDARGTAAQPIIFTSSRDDSAGGDTDNNGPTVAANGNWNTIEFAAGSIDSVMDHVEVRFGGSHAPGQVIVNGGALTLTNSVLRNSNNAGLRMVSASPTVTGITFQNNSAAAASMDLASNPTISGVTVVNNGVNGLRLDGGNLVGNGFWDDPDIVYHLAGTVTVPAGQTLTVAAGTMVKSLAFNGIGVTVAGTLDARGTAAQPILFTSSRDDSAGGDTDNNGPTVAANGNWNTIEFAAGSINNVLDHLEVRFAGSHSGAAIRSAGSLTLSNSLVRNSNTAGVLSTAGMLNLSNTLLVSNSGVGLLAQSGAVVTAVNNTIDGNADGVQVGVANATLKNNLITNNNVGIRLNGAGTVTASFNDVFNPTGQNYVGLPNATGANGNISIDPKYFSRANRQYGLRAGSPAIDAGTSDGAPTTDRFGNPRFDDPNIVNTGGGAMRFFDMGAIERQEISISNIDLATTTVSGPTTGMQDQAVTVNWSVTNLGSESALGSWFDAIYLSVDPIFTPDDLFLGDALHTGDLGAGQSYNATANVTLPGALPGNYYFLVRSNARHEVFEALALFNNTGAAAATVALELPSLFFGTPVAAQLPATGASKFFKVSAPAGADLEVQLTGAAGATNELYVSFGDLPSRQSFDERGVRPSSAAQAVSVAGTQAGVYYVLAYGANLAAVENVTLTARLTGYSISSVSPTRGSNSGQVTLAIAGAQFDANSHPRLIDSAGGTIEPSRVYFTDTGLLSATFDLTGRPTGLADVQVVNSSNVTATLPDALNIIAGQAGRLVTNLVVPGAVRLGRNFTITIDYANEGDADLLAPVMRLANDGASSFSAHADMRGAGNSLSLIAANPTGPAGILPPGARGRITLYGIAETNGTAHFQLFVSEYPTTPINWPAIGPTLRPALFTDAEWDPIFARLQSDLGNSWAGYQQAISNITTLLPASRGNNYDLRDVFQLQYDKAFAGITTAVTGRVFQGDTGHPLGNVPIRLIDPATSQGFETTTNTDGTFLIHSVTPGTYDVTFEGFVGANIAPLVLGSSSLSGIEYIVSRGGAISGAVVLAANGAPLRNALVTAQGENGTGYHAFTDNNGVYTIDSLPADTYEVTAADAPYIHAVKVGVEVGAGQIVQHVNLAVQLGGSVGGTVTGPAGVVAGATVSAHGVDGAVLTAITAANGTYRIEGLSAQQYAFSAIRAGLTTGAAVNVNVSPQAFVSGVNLSMITAGSIQVTVKSGTTNLPLASVTVAIVGASVSTTLVTDVNGKLTAPNLPPGAYTVSTSDFGSEQMSVSQPAVVNAGATTQVMLTTNALGKVTGVVTNSVNGQPVPKVVVHAVNADGLVAATTTEVDGTYTLEGFDVGTYHIILGDEQTPGISRTQVTFGPSQTSATANFSFALAGALSGTVYEANGVTPIANAQVALTQNGRIILAMTADTSGFYVFDLLAAGTYQLEASSFGLAFPVLTSAPVGGGSVQNGLNFIAGSFVINGVVNDALSGQPLTNATVFLQRTDPGVLLGSVGFIFADAVNGTFSFSGAVPGTYEITATAEGHAFNTQIVVVSGGAPPFATLNMAAERTLQGLIRHTATNAAIVGATVILTTSIGFSFSAITDATGLYRFTQLPAGSARLLVRADGFQSVVLPNISIAQLGEHVNAALAPANNSVNGIVRSPTGPLSQVAVTALDNNGVVMASSTTGLDGSYSLMTLAPGVYTIRAAGSGYQDAAPFPVTIGVNSTLNNPDINLSAVALSDFELLPGFLNLNSHIESSGPGLLLKLQQFADADPALPTPFQLSSAELASLTDPSVPDSCKDEQQLAFDLLRVYNKQLKRAQDSFRQLDRDVISLQKHFQAAREALNKMAAILKAIDRLIEFALPNFPVKIRAIINGAKLFLPSPRSLTEIAGFMKVAQSNLGLSTSNTNLRIASAALTELTKNRIPDFQKDVNFLSAVFAKLTGADISKYQPLRGSIFGLGPTEALERIPTLAKEDLGDFTEQIKKITDIPFDTMKSLSENLIEMQKDVKKIDTGLKNIQDTQTLAILFKVVFDEFQRCACIQGPHSNLHSHSSAVAGSFLLMAAESSSNSGCKCEEPAKSDTEREVNSADSINRASFDPNDKTGPAGFGAAGFIQTGTMPFLVQFENDPALGATAAAQIVVVTDVLDADLDLDTLEFTSFGFGAFSFDVPAGLSHYETTLDLRPDGINLLVPVTMEVNRTTRELKVTFESLDPISRIAPDGINDGFLPVNNANHDGEGFFTYLIRPKTGLATGTEIINQAKIVFDTNDFILTPTTHHTLDNGAPTSTVAALPSGSPATFPVSWSGADSAGGSGIASYDIFVSDNGGPFTFWRTANDTMPAMFTGIGGHTYGFYSVATDKVGNRQTPPDAAQATTALALQATLRRNGANLELRDNATGSLVMMQPIAATTPLLINGTAGFANSLSIDLVSGGAFTLPAGSKFTGGTGADRISFQANASATLTNARLTSGAFSIDLASVEQGALTGGPGNDRLDAVGFYGPVTFNGGAGNDTLLGGPGNDMLTGGLGNDTINGGGGVNRLVETGNINFTLTNTQLTGLGTDKLTKIQTATLTGGAGKNVLNATAFTGAVILDGQAGNDILTGGNGADTLIGGPGVDSLNGGAGSDTVSVTSGGKFTLTNAAVISGLGKDTLTNIELAQLIGGAGNDNFDVSGWTKTASVNGGAGVDKILSSNDANFTLTNTRLTRTGGGTFTLTSIESAELRGGANANTINASAFAGTTVLSGGAGNDVLKGSQGGGTLLGGAGNDSITGHNARDLLFGGDGIDTLVGGADDDILFAGPTKFETSAASLNTLFAFWNRTDLDYAARVAQLRAGIPGLVKLNAASVLNDQFVDVLTGALGLDWFFGKRTNPLKDTLKDVAAGELVN